MRSSITVTSEYDTEIKVLSDEVAAVIKQREELKATYIKDDQYFADRETELIKKRFALIQNREQFEEEYEPNP